MFFPLGIYIALKNCDVGACGVEPDVEDISFLGEFGFARFGVGVTIW